MKLLLVLDSTYIGQPSESFFLQIVGSTALLTQGTVGADSIGEIEEEIGSSVFTSPQSKQSARFQIQSDGTTKVEEDGSDLLWEIDEATTLTDTLLDLKLTRTDEGALPVRPG